MNWEVDVILINALKTIDNIIFSLEFMMDDQFIDENRDKIGRPEMSVIGVLSQQVLIISQNIKCMSEYVYAHIHFLFPSTSIQT